MSRYAIEVQDLSKTYQKNHEPVLKGISFNVPSGICCALLGENGAGKTTTLEILQGLRKPSAGTVRIFGMDYSRQEAEIRQRISGTLQETRLYERTRVHEAFQLFSGLYADICHPKRIFEQLQLAPLWNKELRQLSGGQKQKVYIGLALIGKPSMLFLDEPTTGLDPAARREIWQLIQELKKKGMTIILTSHYMEEVEFLSDHVIILSGGSILEQGSPAEIAQRQFRGHPPPQRTAPTYHLEEVMLRLTGRRLLNGVLVEESPL